MNLTDIITLAKQGYKPGDIRELIELSKVSEPEPQPEPKKDPEPATEIVTNEVVKNEKQDDEKDYDAIIANLKAENEKILADLKTAQEHNRQQSMPIEPEMSREDKLKDIAKAFWR